MGHRLTVYDCRAAARQTLPSDRIADDVLLKSQNALRRCQPYVVLPSSPVPSELARRVD